MKKILLLVIAVIAFVAFLDIGKGFMEAMLGSKNSTSYDKRLIEVSKQLNAKLPEQIDDETRCDRTMAGPGVRMTYFYTLINTSVDDLDLAELTAKAKPQLINIYKTNPAMARYREMQVELHVRYRDKNGKDVATIVVSPKDF